LIKKFTIFSIFIFLPLSSFALFGRHHHKENKKSYRHNSSALYSPTLDYNPCGQYSLHPLVDSLLTFAFAHLNRPYCSGSTGPSSFDCSGFTSYVYNHFGYKLDHNSGAQTSFGMEVSKNELQPGDLVFFKGRNARASRVGHVGIVSSVKEDGSFTFIHAANGTGISNDNSTGDYYTRRYVTARRIISQDNTDLIPKFLQRPTPAKAPAPKENILIVPETDSEQDAPKEEANATPSSIKVEKGQNLYSIAKQYNCSPKQLKEWNNLKSKKLKVGQEIKLNGNEDSNTEEAQANNNDQQDVNSAAQDQEKGRILIHHVRKGENLFVIAQKYGCTANDLRKWNNLPTASVRPNQKLYIGAKKQSNSPTYYIVQKGETLSKVAEKNQTSVSKLKKLNHLSTTRIQEGNHLQIQ